MLDPPGEWRAPAADAVEGRRPLGARTQTRQCRPSVHRTPLGPSRAEMLAALGLERAAPRGLALVAAGGDNGEAS